MRISLGMMVLGVWGWIVLSGFSCGPTLKNCKVHSDCPTDSRCRSYSCQLLDHCDTDGDCNAPRTCVKNRCMEPKELCKVNTDCPTGSICDAGICGAPSRPDCQSDRDCLSSELCSQNKCIKDPGIPCSGSGDCSEPYVCEKNRCVKPATGCQSNSDCQAPLVCSKGQCVSSPTVCGKDSDCKTGEQCTGGVCVISNTGICRLSSSVSSLGFYDLKAGESKTQPLKLSNQGTGSCQISQISLRDQQSAVGEFSLAKAWSAQTLTAGQSLEIQVTFLAKASGSLLAALDVFSGSNVLRTVTLHGSVTQDTTIPTSGWATVLYEQNSYASYFSGCFWDNQTFEVASSSVFTEGWQSLQYGNLRTTQDNGNTWKCANCVSGQSWPRTAFYEIVDMMLSGLSCLNDRAYVFGSFLEGDPNNEKPTVYTRTSKTIWTPIREKNNPLNSIVGVFNRVYTWDSRWFVMMQNLVLTFVPEADGTIKKQTMVALMMPQGATQSYNQDFHLAHQIGLLVGFKRTFSGTSTAATPFITYNTTNAVLPQGAQPSDLSQYWKDVTPPCTSCTLYKGRVIDSQSFLVMGVLLDAKSQASGFAIWRTTNRGSTWTKVYDYQGTTALPMGDILAISSQRILVVAGESSQNMGGRASVGLLLESTDGGQSFKPIPVAQLKGKAIQDGKLPALYHLALSPDQKTLFVLGAGIILRWKP